MRILRLRGCALVVCAVALAIPWVAASARADTTPAPIRHVVYSFTYESRQNGAVPNDPGPMESSNYVGSLDSKGTITVDVLKEASDHGLVVVISEDGDNSRRASATTCAVYGNTDVICDPAHQMNSEEYTLLRFLGANFIDPAKIDASQHWTVARTGSTVTINADYTINKNDNGVMSIAGSRHLKDTSGGVVTLDTTTKLDYDFNRLLPTAVDEYTTEQRNTGINGVSTTTYQTTLNLVSDSMAKQ